MSNENYTTTFTVSQSSEEVFNAINNVRDWWYGQIDGETDKLGAEFRYRYENIHDSTQKITEFIVGKKIIWHIIKSSLNFLNDKTELEGTDIIFEITDKNGTTELKFTHAGLVPKIECYDVCSNAWSALVNGNLKKLIETGEVGTNPFASKS